MTGKNISPFLFIGLVAALSAECQVKVIDSLELKWEHYRLKNGLQIILQPDLNLPEVSVEFWVHAGVREEKPGQFGFAHFFEHATPYGLTKDTVLLNAFRSIRTNSNAQTLKDFTRYFIQVKPGGLELALKYSADRLRADTTAILDSVIEKHRRNVLNEMKRQEGNPLYSPTATSAREAATFGPFHFYGHSTYGSIKENESFTTAEVRKWYGDYFYPANIVLFIVGHFDPETTKQLIEREFSGLGGKGRPEKLKSPPAKTQEGNLTLSLPSPSHFLSLTWAIPGFGSADDPSFQILSFILDERFAKTKPFSVITSGASDLFALYEQAGCFGAYASFSSLADSNDVEKFLHSTIQDLINTGISGEELENAKRKSIDLVKEYSRNLGFSESRTELLGKGLLFAGDPGFYLLSLKKQAKLTGKDIQKLAEKWLTKKGARLLCISNKQ